MTAVRWSEGNYIDYTPSSAMSAGDFVMLNSDAGLVGIAETDIPADKLGALAISGIFKVLKQDTTDAFLRGSPGLMQESTGDVDLDVASVGHVAAASAGSGTTEVLILINSDLKVQS